MDAAALRVVASGVSYLPGRLVFAGAMASSGGRVPRPVAVIVTGLPYFV
jgi:hypothetical protein